MAIGVLIDTVVRTTLVLTLAIDLGDRISWPSPLARRAPAPQPSENQPAA